MSVHSSLSSRWTHLARPLTVNGLGAAALILLSGICYTACVQPLLLAIRAGASAKSQLAAEISLGEQLTAKQRSLRAETAGLQELLTTSESPLRKVSSLNALIDEITDLAIDSGFTLRTLQPTQQVPVRHAVLPLSELGIGLAGECSFPVAKTFLRDLVARFPDIRVDSFSLRSTSGNASTADLSMELTWHISQAE